MSVIKFNHDELFRKALENPMVAREFMESHLPQDIKDQIDLATLKMEKESFVEPKLKKSICDVLFSVKFNGGDGYIYTIVEHQSTPDHLISFRLLKYMVNIWDRYVTLYSKTKHLPIIYPCVFYNGTKPYNVPEDLWGLFANQGLARKIFIEGYRLINLHQIQDDEMRSRLWVGALEFFMKHSKKRQLLELWDAMKEQLPILALSQNGKDYITIFIAYTLTHMDESATIVLDKLLNTTLGEDGGHIMVSAAQKLYNDGKLEGMQQGMQQGVQQGMQQGAREKQIEVVRNMLKSNISIDIIERVAGMTIQEIKKLQATL